MRYLIVCVILFSFQFSSCKTKDKMSKMEATDQLKDEMMLRATTPVVVYKTYKDFSNFVPVIMNDDKTIIVSYPDQKDISTDCKPIILNEGYLLDKRGINENVVFLDITYDDYRKMERIPTLEAMNALILEKNPLIELYYCGNQADYKDLIPELNKLIEKGFPNCMKAAIIPMTMEIPFQ